MRDAFFFDKMVTPKIVTFIYWVLLVASLVSGVVFMFSGFTLGKFLGGIAIAIGSAIAARVWCELVIVLFKMNEALQDMRGK